jgi:hypothetical protein
LIPSARWLRSDPIAFLHISQVKPEGASAYHASRMTEIRARVRIDRGTV